MEETTNRKNKKEITDNLKEFLTTRQAYIDLVKNEMIKNGVIPKYSVHNIYGRHYIYENNPKKEELMKNSFYNVVSIIFETKHFEKIIDELMDLSKETISISTASRAYSVRVILGIIDCGFNIKEPKLFSKSIRSSVALFTNDLFNYLLKSKDNIISILVNYECIEDVQIDSLGLSSEFEEKLLNANITNIGKFIERSSSEIEEITEEQQSKLITLINKAKHDRLLSNINNEKEKHETDNKIYSLGDVSNIESKIKKLFKT